MVQVPAVTARPECKNKYDGVDGPGYDAGVFKGMTTGSLTVLFEDPFWVGVFEVEARKQMRPQGIGTKSQQALKVQQEQNKVERKLQSKIERESERQRKFDLRQARKKEKHKGH